MARVNPNTKLLLKKEMRYRRELSEKLAAIIQSVPEDVSQLYRYAENMELLLVCITKLQVLEVSADKERTHD